MYERGDKVIVRSSNGRKSVGHMAIREDGEIVVFSCGRVARVDETMNGRFIGVPCCRDCVRAEERRSSEECRA